MTVAAPVSLMREIPGVGTLTFEQTDKSRAYWLIPEGGKRRVRYPSVTGILSDTWAKPGLVNWAAREAANIDRIREDAFARGHDVHLFIETFMRDGTLLGFNDFPVERKPYLQGAARFLLEHDPQPEAIEQLVCHPEEGYAGRFDLLARLRGKLTLLDFKTSPKGDIYPEAHVQLAAYAVAEARCSGEIYERYAVVGINADGGYRLADTPVGRAQECWADLLRLRATQTALSKALA
jgi:hypothetical protein